MINSIYVTKQITLKHGRSLAKSILEFDLRVRSFPVTSLSFCFAKDLVIEFCCFHALSKWFQVYTQLVQNFLLIDKFSAKQYLYLRNFSTHFNPYSISVAISQ